MDCLTFRRRLLEDPLDSDAALRSHESGCPTCAEFARRTRAQETRLRALLNVTPPPELTERIRLAVSFEKRPTRSHWLALAASLLLAVSIVSGTWYLSPLERRHLTLVDAVMAHVYDEASHMHQEDKVSQVQLAQLFGSFGAQLHGDLGQVNFAAECLMRKKNGIHLVMPGKMGPVTVFFMPDEIPSETMIVQDQRFHGEVMPTAWGSVAVVGELGEPLAGLAKRMADSVNWPVRVSRLDVPLAPLTPPQA